MVPVKLSLSESQKNQGDGCGVQGRQQQIYSPLIIGGTPVNRERSFKYLNVHITEDLTWTHHIHARDVQQWSDQQWSVTGEINSDWL